MRLAALIAFVALVSTAASAAEKAGDPGTNVPMPFLIVPMSDDGKLLGYSYVSSKLVASSQAAALEIRAKIGFIQDAFVRDVNAAPVALASDPTAIDTVLLGNRLVADARRLLGSAKVTRIVFGDGGKDTGVKFAPLHPSQTPVKADQMDNVTPPAKPKP